MDVHREASAMFYPVNQVNVKLNYFQRFDAFLSILGENVKINLV